MGAHEGSSLLEPLLSGRLSEGSRKNIAGPWGEGCAPSSTPARTPCGWRGTGLLQESLSPHVMGDEKVGRCLVGTRTCAQGSNLPSRRFRCCPSPLLFPHTWPAPLRSRNRRPAAAWFQARAPGRTEEEPCAEATALCLPWSLNPGGRQESLAGGCLWQMAPGSAHAGLRCPGQWAAVRGTPRRAKGAAQCGSPPSPPAYTRRLRQQQ